MRAGRAGTGPALGLRPGEERDLSQHASGQVHRAPLLVTRPEPVHQAEAGPGATGEGGCRHKEQGRGKVHRANSRGL